MQAEDERAQAEQDFHEQAQIWDLIAKITWYASVSLCEDAPAKILPTNRVIRTREGSKTVGQKPEELLEQNRYLAPRSLVNAIFRSDRTLQEWTVGTSFRTALDLCLRLLPLRAIQLIKDNLETYAQPSDHIPSTLKRAKSSYRHETLQEARRLRNLRTTVNSDASTSLDLDGNVRHRGVRGSGSLAGKDKVCTQS
jgi:hypothetical protein